MSEPDRRPQWILGIVLVLHLLLATLWSVTVPPFETPDEPGHARYVNFLLEHRRLPVAGEEAPGEAHQPPLYYAVAAVVAGVTGSGPIPAEVRKNAHFRWYGGTQENKYLHDGDPTAGTLHRLRLLSVVLSAGTIVCVYLMGAVSGIVSRRAAAIAAGVAAFIPQFSFVSGSLNNDNLANLLSAAALTCLVFGMRAGAGLRPWGLAGLFTGLGLLTKFTGLAMIPCGLLAIWIHRGAGRQRAAAAFLVPALLTPAPLLIRNAMVLGDALGAGAQVRTLPNLLDPKGLSDAYFVTEFPVVLFESFWGRFGWMSFRAPTGLYLIALVATIIALTGLLISRRGAAASQTRILFGAAIVIQIAQVAIYNLTFTQAQGRFLFPVIGPVALLVCAGIAEVARRAGWKEISTRGALLVTAGLVILNLSLLALVVAPAYQPGAALP